MKIFNFLILILVLSACGHHRDVRPSSDGLHTVIVTSEEQEVGQRDAINQANHFCDERYKKVAAISKEGTKYTGDMDEDEYRRAKMAGKILQQSGSSAWVFGGKRESNAGQAASGVGNVIRSSTGKGYTTHMTFNCI